METTGNERSIDELIRSFNAQAQAEGRYDSRIFWEVPARPGSIRDIPETDKSKEDLAWFRTRRLAKRCALAHSALPAEVKEIGGDRGGQARSKRPTESASQQP